MEIVFHRSDNQNTRDYNRSLIRAVEDGRITERDKQLINSFISRITVNNDISTGRQLKICRSLILWRNFVSEYENSTYDDIVIGIKEIRSVKSKNGTKYKQNTLRDHINFLKRFYIWLIDSGYSSIPEKEIKKIKIPTRDKMTKTVGDILTPAEVKKMIEACSNNRDRAMISMLYEGAFRAGEIGNLKWGDVEFRDTGLVVNTDFKTGKPRRIPLANTTPYLANLKDDYPYKITPDMPVFLTYVNNDPHHGNDESRPAHKYMTYAGIRKQLKIIAEKAGIEKNVTPHIFRHSRITHLVKAGYPESYIKRVCWGSLTTDQLETYLHLDDTYIDETFYQFEGIKPKEEFEKTTLEAIQCPRCASINSNSAKFCRKCGLPLDDQTALAYDQIQRFLNNFVTATAREDPQKLVEIISEYTKKIN
ncbi:integrase/ribosomal protein L40E [Methanomicrobium sp. W14]|uniref:tyrosine-type recombinase/integrase n=1 Tax=Methanomicrobium sp. W14 TaxID=2817839 RepID=UPI001AE680BC|nr:tyrosine-type recombinase/integrase [Methanomicrobium sp. W14]MBP2133967.1 integrase/ribosomal protein L40E [Methanomicrobium sp. W14]